MAVAVLVLLAPPRGARAETLVPPRVLQSPSAIYPAGHGDASGVKLSVTIDETGVVQEVTIAESGGADFDKAADTAVRKWKFAPATRDGVPFKARVKIPFTFLPPVAPSVSTAATAAAPAAPAAAPPTPPPAGVPPAPPAAPPPTVVAVPVAAAPQETEPAKPANPNEATVRGTRRQPQHGGSDFEITIGQLAEVASESPEKILELAPGIFIANEGGAGHADQVFLRGFDAETGSALEFTMNGVPLNQVNNPDGHGYADTHFIIPELVENLRVVEGPFDPHQGDFAVAGSVDYQLGVKTRGLRVQNDYGSFNTERILALWAPLGEHEGTFAAAQFESSNGFGSNRAFQSATGMAEYEGPLGTKGLWRLLATAYGINYKSAGPVRLDSIQSGLINFYGTQDPTQGGNAQRFSLSFDLQNPLTEGLVTEQLFLIYNVNQIVEDWTGFLNDTDQYGQSAHPQRGDAIQQDYMALTFGSRGAYRISHPIFGLDQAVEIGYYARYDHTTPSIDTLRFGTQTPYLVNESLVTDIVNLAGYVDFDLKPVRWLILRGGIRQEYFNYNVTNNCATAGNYPPSGGQPLNETCPPFDDTGPRLPSTQVTASGQITEPKVTAQVLLPKEFTLTGSFGIGAQSMDAQYISQNENAPFTLIQAGEGGLLFHHRWTKVDLSARAIAFYTHTGLDLIFNPELGRLAEAPGTTRVGGIGALRVSGTWFDELASATYAHAEFDASGGQLVPYIPEWIVRSDTAVHGVIPWFRLFSHALVGSAGMELSYVGVRALPYGQSASPTFVMDITAAIRWRWIKLGIRCDNLLNSQYPSGEFFYASNFYTRGPYETLTPTESITAAPPRAFMFTAAFLLDEESNR
jgi:TonB family protein